MKSELLSIVQELKKHLPQKKQGPAKKIATFPKVQKAPIQKRAPQRKVPEAPLPTKEKPLPVELKPLEKKNREASSPMLEKIRKYCPSLKLLEEACVPYIIYRTEEEKKLLSKITGALNNRGVPATLDKTLPEGSRALLKGASCEEIEARLTLKDPAHYSNNLKLKKELWNELKACCCL